MKSVASFLFAVALCVPLLAAGQAGNAPRVPPRLRGTVESLSPDSLTIRTADGVHQTVKLPANWTVTVLKPIDVSAILPGSFIGTAEMPQKDGTGRSLEVHVFPPGVKAGEGHYAWDSKPGSMMTNGTVGKVVSSAHGRELRVTYPEGERTIVVLPGVPIVQMGPGDRSLIKPGVSVLLFATADADGKLTARGVLAGENGAPPPF